MSETFVEQVVQGLDRREMSRAALARQAGVHPNTLYNLLSGRATRPSARVAAALAAVLDIEMPMAAAKVPRGLAITTADDTTCGAVGCDEDAQHMGLCDGCARAAAAHPLPRPRLVGDVDEGWTARASCRGHADPSLWYPDGGPSPLALRHCMDCPVRAECFTDAMTRGEVTGVWGGIPFTVRTAKLAA